MLNLRRFIVIVIVASVIAPTFVWTKSISAQSGDLHTITWNFYGSLPSSDWSMGSQTNFSDNGYVGTCLYNAVDARIIYNFPAGSNLYINSLAVTGAWGPDGRPLDGFLNSAFLGYAWSAPHTWDWSGGGQPHAGAYGTSGVDYAAMTFQFDYPHSCSWIETVTMTYYGTLDGTTPTPTPTVSPTPTPSPTPTLSIAPTDTTGGSIPPYGCTLMPLASTFSDVTNTIYPNDSTNQRWFVAGDGGKSGSELRIGKNSSAYVYLNLSPNDTYEISATYHFEDLTNNTDWRLNLGNSPTILIRQNSGDGTSVVIPESSYTPTAAELSAEGLSYYTLRLTNPSAADDASAGSIFFSYICVRKVSTNQYTGGSPNGAPVGPVGAGSATPGIINNSDGTQSCEQCSAHYVSVSNVLDFGSMWENIKIAFGLLWCMTRQLWDCTLIPWLGGLLANIGKAILGILNWLYLLGSIVKVFVEAFARYFGVWLSAFGEWLGGWLPNVLIYIRNIFIELANKLSAQGGFLGFIGGIITTIFVTVPNFIAQLASTISLYAQFVWAFVGLFIGQIQQILNFGNILIGLILDFLQNGLSSTTSITNAPLPFCNTTASQIPETCVWLWMIDWTALKPDGLVWNIFSIVKYPVALGVMWWFVTTLSSKVFGNEAES